MAVENLTKVAVSLRLNNGTDSQGNVKTVGVSLGSISMSGYTADKARNVALALSPCLSKTVSRVETTKTFTITAA